MDIQDTLPNGYFKCKDCCHNIELTADEKKVRCAGKSYSAGWRHIRRGKCKHYATRRDI